MTEAWEDKGCHDCGCKHGELHTRGCDAERCPFCHGQLISCSCAEKLLGIDPYDEEFDKHGLNENQSIEWEAMLAEKGRIPYESPWKPGAADNVWAEFIHPDGGCSLCCNSGIVDTRGRKNPRGQPAGARSYCICPNGRAAKNRMGKATWSPHPAGDSIIAPDGGQ
jgi:hypothetical protein